MNRERLSCKYCMDRLIWSYIRKCIGKGTDLRPKVHSPVNDNISDIKAESCGNSIALIWTAIDHSYTQGIYCSPCICRWGYLKLLKVKIRINCLIILYIDKGIIWHRTQMLCIRLILINHHIFDGMTVIRHDGKLLIPATRHRDIPWWSNRSSLMSSCYNG